jgi:hypothetical protein
MSRKQLINVVATELVGAIEAEVARGVLSKPKWHFAIQPANWTNCYPSEWARARDCFLTDRKDKADSLGAEELFLILAALTRKVETAISQRSGQRLAAVLGSSYRNAKAFLGRCRARETLALNRGPLRRAA